MLAQNPSMVSDCKLHIFQVAKWTADNRTSRR